MTNVFPMLFFLSFFFFSLASDTVLWIAVLAGQSTSLVQTDISLFLVNFCTDIQGLVTINPNDFDDPLTFFSSTSIGWIAVKCGIDYAHPLKKFQ